MAKIFGNLESKTFFGGAIMANSYAVYCWLLEVLYILLYYESLPVYKNFISIYMYIFILLKTNKKKFNLAGDNQIIYAMKIVKRKILVTYYTVYNSSLESYVNMGICYYPWYNLSTRDREFSFPCKV